MHLIVCIGKIEHKICKLSQQSKVLTERDVTPLLINC